MKFNLWKIINFFSTVDDILNVASIKGSTPISEACNVVFEAIKTGNLEGTAHVNFFADAFPPIKWSDGNWYDTPPHPPYSYEPTGKIDNSIVTNVLDNIRSGYIRSFEELTPNSRKN